MQNRRSRIATGCFHGLAGVSVLALLSGCGWFDSSSPADMAKVRPGAEQNVPVSASLPPPAANQQYDPPIAPVDDMRDTPKIGSIVPESGGQKAQIEKQDKEEAARDAEEREAREGREGGQGSGDRRGGQAGQHDRRQSRRAADPAGRAAAGAGDDCACAAALDRRCARRSDGSRAAGRRQARRILTNAFVPSERTRNNQWTTRNSIASSVCRPTCSPR